MVKPEDYERREQAYVKHIVLKHYLQQLALKIGNFKSGTTLNYIDGFSGPWQHSSEELRARGEVEFEVLIAAALQHPMTSLGVPKDWLDEWRKGRVVEYVGLAAKERVLAVNKKHRLRWCGGLFGA